MEETKGGGGGWAACILACALTVAGCVTAPRAAIRPPARPPDRKTVFEVTAYCPCGACCGWRRNWLGRPVYAAGPRKGRRKDVGVTASGTRARRGTIAADTALLPFGTILYVPGYGYGRVEDRGGGIDGHHIDLFFPTHREALAWGRVRREVTIWLPGP